MSQSQAGFSKSKLRLTNRFVCSNSGASLVKMKLFLVGFHQKEDKHKEFGKRIYYGSAPKEKQSQERQPKTTNEVASQQAENAPQLDDLVIDTGGAVASGGGATLSDQKSETPRGKIKQPGKCTAWNGKLCQCLICKRKIVLLCQCGDKSHRNDLDICPDCGHTIPK
uniref:Uncharacterized protein n=1 Tax=Biomphalaria glabrata TaxID=6526 RepID=A0A2C9KZN0_BIOGL